MVMLKQQDQDMLDRCAGVRRALPGIRADIEEAKALAEGRGDALAVVLTELADAAEAAINFWRPDNVERAYEALRVARVALDLAGAARECGSFDREEALRLEGDVVHASQIANIRARELDLARNQSREWVATKLDRLTPVLAGRRLAERMVDEHAALVLRGGDTLACLTSDYAPEATLFEPLFQARALAKVQDDKSRKDMERDFDMRAKQVLRRFEQVRRDNRIAALVVEHHTKATSARRRAAPAEAANAGPK
jgi:hypothetical protein